MSTESKKWERSERDYEGGRRSAARRLLFMALELLGFEGTEGERNKWILERERAVATLRDLCKQWGDNDWESNLDLGDVIVKHLAIHLEDNSALKGNGSDG